MPVITRVPDFVEGKSFIIENVLVDHCSVFKPNTTYRPEWAVVIRVPQHLQQQFYEVGFRLKRDANGQVTLRAKRYVRLDNGEEMRPPEVVDADNQLWPESRGLIGNGSRANVKVRAKYTTYQGVEGLSCFLEGLQVLDHVPYVPKSGVAFGAAPGNTAGWQAPAQPVQQQAPAGGFAPQSQAPAPQQPQYQPQPQQQFPSQQGFVPPGAEPVAQAPAPQSNEWHPGGVAAVQPNPAVPQHMVPQGMPEGGNVSQPPQPLQSALGGGIQQQPEEPSTDTYPVNASMGDDVPF